MLKMKMKLISVIVLAVLMLGGIFDSALSFTPCAGKMEFGGRCMEPNRPCFEGFSCTTQWISSRSQMHVFACCKKPPRCPSNSLGGRRCLTNADCRGNNVTCYRPDNHHQRGVLPKWSTYLEVAYVCLCVNTMINVYMKGFAVPVDVVQYAEVRGVILKEGKVTKLTDWQHQGPYVTRPPDTCNKE